MNERRGTVGVRELRQNLSVYLGRIAESGETLQVTDRNRPVAVLGPVPVIGTAIGRLVAAGRASPPRGDLLDLAPPRGRATRRLSRALARDREDRR